MKILPIQTFYGIAVPCTLRAAGYSKMSENIFCLFFCDEISNYANFGPLWHGFESVVVFTLKLHFLFISCSAYCDPPIVKPVKILLLETKFSTFNKKRSNFSELFAKVGPFEPSYIYSWSIGHILECEFFC